MSMTRDDRKLVIDAAFRATAQAAAADGNLIEFHWRLFRRLALPLDMPAAEVSERRLAFLAGSESTFTFMMQMDDARAEVMIDNLYAECDRIACELQLRFGETQGNA